MQRGKNVFSVIFTPPPTKQDVFVDVISFSMHGKVGPSNIICPSTEKWGSFDLLTPVRTSSSMLSVGYTGENIGAVERYRHV